MDQPRLDLLERPGRISIIKRLLVIPALAFVATASAGTQPLQPPRFAPAAGWHTRVGKAHACPGVPASRCVQVFSVASTTPWRDCLACLPHRTVAAMSKDDVAIQIDVARESAKLRPTFTWPPQITRPQVAAGFEGLPSRISTYQGHGRVRRREVSVFVLFGRPRPTNGQLRRANAELRRVRF